MNYVLGLVCVITFVLCIVCGQEDFCVRENQEGQCVLLEYCAKLLPLIKVSRHTLTKYHCGWEKNVPKVCCPTTSPSTITTSSTTQLPVDFCVPVDGDIGTCVPSSSCPHIKKMLETKTAASVQYYQRSRCPGSSLTHVCCALAIDPSIGIGSRDSTCTESAIPPDPTSLCCGVESYSGNKIINGQEAAIDQYPWLALIEYTRPQVCGGSLISNRYVLTAAHCILNKSNKPRGAVAVLLGEFNTTNEGPDCVPVEGGAVDCNFGSERVSIEKAITHPEYNKQQIVQYAHDIALLRLSKMVTFNDFIKPICLPTSDITIKPPPNLRLYVAGWGAVNVTRITSDVKLYTSLPYVKYQQCESTFTTLQGTLIWENQICAGGELNKDTCKGDSGGPLMYESDKLQEIVGIISFGLLQCGLKRPSVYTKVYNYRSWIYGTIEP